MSEHELWNELGNLYFLSGIYDQAVHAYNRAINLRPDAGELYNNLALTYEQMGRDAEASDSYQHGVCLLKDELDKAVALQKLGDVYIRLKKFLQAAEAYQQAEELVSDLGRIVNASRPPDLLLHCQASDTGSQPPYAADSTAVVSRDVNSQPLIEELTPWWFVDQIEPEEDAEPHYDFGFLESVVYDSNENISSVEPLVWEINGTSHAALVGCDADALNSHSVDDTISIAEAQSTVDHTPGAALATTEKESIVEVMISERVIDVNNLESVPSAVPIMVITDEPTIMTDSPEFSTQNMTTADPVQYKMPADWPVVELSKDERNKIQADIKKFKRTLEKNPGNAFTWDSLGSHYKTLGQYDEAISAFQRAVSLDSSKAFYFHHLGLVYAAVGRHEDAIDAFERVLKVDPDHSLAHATLGGYHRKNGNEELAKAHIERAKSLLSEDENDYNRACMEAICGNADRSLELLELALKDKQTYVNWALKDPDFDFVRSDPRFRALLAEYAAKAE